MKTIKKFRCKVCGDKKEKHYAKSLCQTCWRRQYMVEYRRRQKREKSKQISRKLTAAIA